MNYILMSLMNDRLMNLSNFLLIYNWPVFFMNDVLMILVHNVFVMLMNHILMMLMDNVSVRLFYNRNCSVRFYSWSYMMSFNKGLFLMALNDSCLIMSNKCSRCLWNFYNWCWLDLNNSLLLNIWCLLLNNWDLLLNNWNLLNNRYLLNYLGLLGRYLMLDYNFLVTMAMMMHSFS